MRIVVTGALGYIGCNLIRSFFNEPGIEEVVAIDNSPLCEERCDILEHDVKDAKFTFKGVWKSITDVADVIYFLEGVDVVVHAASVTTVNKCYEDPIGSWQNNVDGTRKLLDMASVSGVKKFILLSCSGIYGHTHSVPVREDTIINPRSEYHIQKLAQEYDTLLHNRDFTIEGVIARLSNVYGVGIVTEERSIIANFILRALAGKPLQIYGDGHQKRNFIHISDVTAAIKKMIFSDHKLAGEIINIAGPRDIEIADLAEMILKRFAVGKKHIPYMNDIEPISQHSISIEKAKRILDFVSTTKLEDSIETLIEYYRQQKKAKPALRTRPDKDVLVADVM